MTAISHRVPEGRDGLGAACREAVRRLMAAVPDADGVAVYLERGGRLRCVAAAGTSPVHDGVPPAAGALGVAYRTGREALGHVAGPTGDDEPAACLPVRAGGDIVGVLALRAPVPVAEATLRHARACAVEVGGRVAVAGGPPPEAPSRRLLRHLGRMTAIEPAHLGPEILQAALEALPLESALVAQRMPGQGLRPRWATGPLAGALGDLSGPALAAIERAVEHGGSWVTRDGVPPELPSLVEAGARTVAAAGMVVRGRPTGLLLLADRRRILPGTDDLELLELLAVSAAGALHSADTVAALRHRAETDPLTGLGHHATFHAALAHAHRRPSTAVLLCDLDGFKALNDTHGHQHGDEVLRGVADALRGAVRRGDELFRIGGDEFAALVVVRSVEEALEAGDRLRAAVDAAGLGVTVSVGVAVPAEDEPEASALARADRALYRVKAEGRDGVALAEDGPLAEDDPLAADAPLA
ncbi:MAG TPA: GGDEF domain-containing protein [Solirubrobacteraceae bacterium]|nr:GGDEF domain-containing protein [Solirubrobacteraceae bacterium]